MTDTGQVAESNKLTDAQLQQVSEAFGMVVDPLAGVMQEVRDQLRGVATTRYVDEAVAAVERKNHQAQASASAAAAEAQDAREHIEQLVGEFGRFSANVTGKLQTLIGQRDARLEAIEERQDRHGKTMQSQGGAIGEINTMVARHDEQIRDNEEHLDGLGGDINRMSETLDRIEGKLNKELDDERRKRAALEARVARLEEPGPVRKAAAKAARGGTRAWWAILENKGAALLAGLLVALLLALAGRADLVGDLVDALGGG